MREMSNEEIKMDTTKRKYVDDEFGDPLEQAFSEELHLDKIGNITAPYELCNR